VNFCDPGGMDDRRLSLLDRFMLTVSLALLVAALVMVASGIAMFWGPLRQVLLAPIVIAIGAAAYVASRALWWTVTQYPSRPAAQ